ncbi:MAG TPA: tetratricopeptide repeat protein [Polyangiaceae bacterium]|nr:tetratricopeptide repeat protein [Polyangiaceae bacterium]
MKVAVFVVAWAGGLALALPSFFSSPVWAQESQLDALRASAKSNGSNAAAALATGRALRRAGDSADALVELRRAAALASSQPDVLIAVDWEIARAHMDRHDFLQARAACRVLGALPGASAEGHACAAGAHLVWQRASEALAEVALALAADPRCYQAKVAEGRAGELTLDAAKSEAAFRVAIGWRPEGVDAHVGLGRVLLRDGARDEALAELRRAVQLDPNGPDALYELGMALPPGPESAALLERATRERPSFADAWLALGTQELSAGRLAEARKAGEATARHDAKSVGPHVLLGKVALADGRYDDAIHEGERALSILASSAPAKLLVADADAKKGDLDRALEAYQAAWGLDHGDPTPLVHAAEACHAAGRDTSARAFGAKASLEFPAWGPGWAALGDALAAQGEKRTARDAYAKALSGGGPVDRAAVQKKLATLR